MASVYYQTYGPIIVQLLLLVLTLAILDVAGGLGLSYGARWRTPPVASAEWWRGAPFAYSYAFALLRDSIISRCVMVAGVVSVLARRLQFY